MKLLLCLIAVLYVCIELSNSVEVGDPRINEFFERLRPYWQRHKARLRPFTFANPAPLWRVAKRSIQDDAVHCVYVAPELYCMKNQVEEVRCNAVKQFNNPLLNKFFTFEISDVKQVSLKREDGEKLKEMKFNLYPKREENITITAAELIQNGNPSRVSLHSAELSDKEEGIRVVDKECWSQMMKLFESVNYRNTIKVEKAKSVDKVWTDTVDTIGNVVVLN